MRREQWLTGQCHVNDCLIRTAVFDPQIAFPYQHKQYRDISTGRAGNNAFSANGLPFYVAAKSLHYPVLKMPVLAAAQ